MSGVLISVEGIDGSGGSTQVKALVDELASTGRRVVQVREPGSTEVAERVRAILLDTRSDIGPRAELLLYLACRAQLVDETIRPALAEGAIVVADRFIDSSVAYQGYGRNLGGDVVAQGNWLATGGIVPDLTFVLDLPVDAAAARRTKRDGSADGDRLESEPAEFHERVRQGFLGVAKAEPNRVVVIDATRSIADVTSTMADELHVRAPRLWPQDRQALD
jgi:dTMP kinase